MDKDREHRTSPEAAVAGMLEAMAASMRQVTQAIEQFAEDVKHARTGLDRHAIADHPDLDNLNHEFNNLYGNSFD